MSTTSNAAGRFNRRIDIQALGGTPNNSGGSAPNWTTVYSRVAANFSYPPPSKKGDEHLLQQQVQSSVFATITIRYRPSANISAAMRVVYGTRIFNIRSVIVDDESYKTITMQCEELQARGSLHT